MSMVIPKRSGRKYEPYPEYKDSGIEWLREIPTHWEITRLKYAFVLQRGFDLASENFINGSYPVCGSNGIIGHHIEFTTKGPSVTVGRSGSVGEVNYYEGDFWAHNTALYVREFLKSNPRFVYFLLKVLDLKSLSEGTAVGTLNRNHIHRLLLALPPVKEQQAIADFLDQETTRIDELVAKKHRLIELLKEKRCALVHEAIQGSDTVNLRLGAVVDEICRIINRDDEEIYIPIGLYNWGRGIFHKEPTLGVDLGDSNFSWIEEDDLVLSGQFAWEGAVALAGEEESGRVASHRYSVLRGKPELLDTSYLFAFFTTQIGDFLLNEHSRGAAGRNRPLNVRTLLKEKIPVPPMKAQLLISRHVNFEEQFKKIVAESLIFLSEYRSALITATVTGKIDVRQQMS